MRKAHINFLIPGIFHEFLEEESNRTGVSIPQVALTLLTTGFWNLNDSKFRAKFQKNLETKAASMKADKMEG